MKYLKYFEKINHKPDVIDIIINSYLETAIWTADFDDDADVKTIYDFSDKARKQAKEEIEWFLKNAGDVFSDVSYTSIGHDLWLSRNHHGSGFFDRNYDDEVTDFLMDLSHELGEINIYVDSNDKINFDISSEKYKEFNLEKYLKDKEFKKTIKKYNL